MVREHFAAIDAEFAMTKGGGAEIRDGRVTVVGGRTAEEVPAICSKLLTTARRIFHHRIEGEGVLALDSTRPPSRNEPT
jgi:hypothetical protein